MNRNKLTRESYCLEGFMNNFNFENKKFRNEYEDKEEMINEKESNILSLQAKIDEQIR